MITDVELNQLRDRAFGKLKRGPGADLSKFTGFARQGLSGGPSIPSKSLP